MAQPTITLAGHLTVASLDIAWLQLVIGVFYLLAGLAGAGAPGIA